MAGTEAAPRPFILVGMPRTGSSLLASGIGQHPLIEMHGELFHRVRTEREGAHAIRRDGKAVYFDEVGDDAIGFLRREVFGAAAPGAAAVGFKLHAEFVSVPSTRGLLQRLKEEFPSLAIVHVVRRNYLDVLISRRVAERTGKWHLPKGEAQRPLTSRLHIDPVEALRFFETMEHADHSFEQVFGDGAYLQVSHEMLSRSFHAEMQRVYRFLDLPGHDATPLLEKQITTPAAEIVENFEALRAFFSGTTFAPLFNPRRRRMSHVNDSRMRIEDFLFRVNDSPAVARMFSADRDFVLMKRRRLIEEYERVFEALRPGNMMELGIRRGGSMAMFNLAFRPRVHLGIEIDPEPIAALREIAEVAAAEGRVFRPVHGTDQADAPALFAALRDALGHDPKAALDIVIDDASHRLAPSRASFEALFPCLRPGGIYALEDWGWAHWAQFQGPNAFFADEAALTTLVFELLILHTARPDIIAGIRITPAVVFLERGPADITPGPFRIAPHLVLRGRQVPEI